MVQLEFVFLHIVVQFSFQQKKNELYTINERLYCRTVHLIKSESNVHE